MNTKNKRIRLTKLKDLKFEGKHPNEIYVGYIKEGIALNDVTINTSLMISSSYKQFFTTDVKKINDDNTFETENSLYKIEFIESDQIIDNKFSQKVNYN